ncbi:hydrolase [Dictyobacter alpinus]|uniref:Hydrolase n=1 Tax=Dictyobacter alpinus TaxID=2014873 RepID=A0A402B3D0_9CHLR|nr:alpha/beta hydrolase [Dictyobacter alpinus]GCE25859.1 hydrolase [Dictyobacter alpinus]
MGKEAVPHYTAAFAAIDGTQIYYEVAGSGHPLVLLHGHDPLDHHFWELQFSYFAQHYRVLRFDPRGYGKSPASTQPYKRTVDLFALLQNLDMQSAYVLDVGARSSLAFIHEYPKAVDALVLASPMFRTAKSFADAFKGLPTILQEFQPLIQPMKQENYREAGELFLKMLKINPSTLSTETYQWLAALMEEAIPSMKHPPKRGLTNLKALTHQLQWNTMIHVPTLIIEGEYAPDIIRATCRDLEQTLPNYTKKTIPNGHMLINIENPTDFNCCVHEFLQTIPNSAL